MGIVRADTSEDAPLNRIRFRALGSSMEAVVSSEDHELASERLQLVRTWMVLVDETLSRFKESSELSRLNRYTVLPPVVSPLLWDALEWALTAASTTEGIYDPTVLPALLASGYNRDFASLSEPIEGSPLPELEQMHPSMDWHSIEMDPFHRTVSLPSLLQIDLGGTAKGWAAARALEFLAPLGPALVNAGGDLAVHEGYPDPAGWVIAVDRPNGLEHAGKVTSPMAVLRVNSCGLATSGVDYRSWINHGRRMHHLIDPQTMQPAETDLLSATVVAPDAALADLYAMIVMILGLEEGLAYLERHDSLEGLLVDQNGTCWQTEGFPELVLKSNCYVLER